MRRLPLGLPLWLIVSVVAVPLIAASLSETHAVGGELVLPTAIALEVVFLSSALQQALKRIEVLRHFGFALWELHQEMSAHLENLERRKALVRQGVTGEPRPDALRSWSSSVDPFPDDAWERFLTVGGLHRLLDTAPDQVAANLYRYYDGVRTFNNEAALRDRTLERLFSVTGPATTGIFKSVRSSDQRLEAWLVEVPSRLAVLIRDLQQVLQELRGIRGLSLTMDVQGDLNAVRRREDAAYERWKSRRRGLPMARAKADWDWPAQDDPVE
ncbi:MAG TPA: hypothetical protein VFA17_00975 [Thermoplasmata archaeon]|jgi:hypothetical protein|nr:hypothetical protein [Thermoplasmata archaeon]